VAGFRIGRRRDWAARVRLMEADPALRERMSRAAGEYAREALCHAARHREAWGKVLLS